MVDVFIVIMMIGSLIDGWRKKFISRILFLGGIIGSFVITYRYYKAGGELLKIVVKNANLAQVISFTLIFMIILGLINLIISLLRFLTNILPFSGINSIGGLILGGINGAIIIGIFSHLFHKYPFWISAKLMDKSILSYYLETFTEISLSFFKLSF